MPVLHVGADWVDAVYGMDFRNHLLLLQNLSIPPVPDESKEQGLD